MTFVGTCMHTLKDHFAGIVSTRCASAVHKKMIAKVLRAPVNLFFDVTPTGTIVKRLQGIDVLDYHFKGTIMHLTYCIIGVLQVFILLIYTSW
jgi:ABC-type bacteriocin/lantibiotic exporter with double-glycine peptidase domain